MGKQTPVEQFPIGSKVRYVGDNDDPVWGSKVWQGMRSADLTVTEVSPTGYVTVLRDTDPHDWFVIAPYHLELLEASQ